MVGASTALLLRKCACGNHTIAGGECAECGKKKRFGLQTKLKVNEPGDIHEQEADRIADQVLGVPLYRAVSGVAPRLQHFLAQPNGQTDKMPARVGCTRANPDRPLGPGIGQDMERRFDHDFSRVRAHSANPWGQRYGADSHYGFSEECRTMTGEPGSDSPEFNVMPGQAENAEATSGELPGSPSACVMHAAMPYSRSGIIRSSTGSVTEDFEVRVEWSSAEHRGEASYCAAECGEYHQFIKGYMWSSPNKDGSDLTDVSGKVFGGKPLNPNVFQEDGRDNNPKARYGHRNEKQTMNEKYEPDRATGTKYIGRDSPGVHIGTFADFDVTFIGKLVDTCNGTETVSSPWRVFFRGVIRP
jgi:hypothetical protein